MRRFVIGMIAGCLIGFAVLFGLMITGKLGRASGWWQVRTEVKRLEKAYANGDTGAAVELSGLYFSRGKREKAFRWVSLAAEKGDAEGQEVLSEMYAYGVGAATDTGKARMWLEKSARQGYLPAVRRLAAASFSAQPPDYELAMKLFLQVAATGDEEAIYFIGFMHENGLGVKADPKTAAAWYARARTNPLALCALAGLYESGLGVKKDVMFAHRLYITVLAANVPDLRTRARAGAVRTYRLMSPAQRKQFAALLGTGQPAAGGKRPAAKAK